MSSVALACSSTLLPGSSAGLELGVKISVPNSGIRHERLADVYISANVETGRRNLYRLPSAQSTAL